jgi:hypothetical protein
MPTREELHEQRWPYTRKSERKTSAFTSRDGELFIAKSASNRRRRKKRELTRKQIGFI